MSKTIKCKNCGREFSGKTKNCPYCGEEKDNSATIDAINDVGIVVSCALFAAPIFWIIKKTKELSKGPYKEL